MNLAKWFLDTNRCDKSDAAGIKFVLEASQKLPTICDAQADDADEPPLEDRMKRVLKLLDENLTENSHHGRQSSSATATEFTIGEVNGEPLDNKFDEGHNDHACSGVSVDKSSSAILEDLYEVVRRKLENYEQRTKFRKVDPNLSIKTLLPF